MSSSHHGARRKSESSPLYLHKWRLMRLSVNICALLKRAFSPSLKCDTVQESFSSPPLTSERFSASSTYQYFHILPKIAHFSTFVSTEYCSSHEGCTSEVLALNEASTLDLDFDAISHAIVLTASWAPGEHPGVGGTEGMIRRLGAQDSIEVGVLQSEKPDEPEELKFGGYLTVIGEDDKPGGWWSDASMSVWKAAC